MKAVTVKAEKRVELGIGAVNRLRRRGFVPGVIYGEDVNLPVAIPEGELRRIPLGTSRVIKLAVAGEKEHSVLVRELQKDPVSRKITHLDFLAVSMTEVITATVVIKITGEAKGVREGGLLQYGVPEVEIECLPADIPEAITVDVTDLEIGDQLKVEDLTAPAGVTILTDPDKLVVSVVAPQTEAIPEAGEEGEQEPEAVPAEHGDQEQ